ncbi:hypothetical protein EDD85DRAFT_933826, partial [Armillaria nabsnona]
MISIGTTTGRTNSEVQNGSSYGNQQITTTLSGGGPRQIMIASSSDFQGPVSTSRLGAGVDCEIEKTRRNFWGGKKTPRCAQNPAKIGQVNDHFLGLIVTTGYSCSGFVTTILRRSLNRTLETWDQPIMSTIGALDFMPYTFHVAVRTVAFQAPNTYRQRGVIRSSKSVPKPALNLLEFVIRFIDISVRRARNSQPRVIQGGAWY